MKAKQIIKLTLCSLIILCSCKNNNEPIGSDSGGNSKENSIPIGNTIITNGAIQASFSISNTKKVYFSKGNLQYQAATKTYRFAENQYDIIGEQNAKIEESYSDFIDLFGWGTANNPTNISLINSEYTNFSDWGNKEISNGRKNVWRTLTKEEWNFLVNSSSRYGFAIVNNVNGLVLLPDGCQLPEALAFITGSISNNDNLKDYATTLGNKYSIEEWRIMESYGAVFLPMAGYRIQKNIFECGKSGHYWTSNTYNNEESYSLFFNGNITTPSDSKFKGFSVRLVQDIN